MIAAAGLACLLVGPNLFWLSRSTARVENRAAQAAAPVVMLACGKETSLGSIAPGASRFVVLPKCGDDTLEIRVGAQPARCRTYIEGEMYHVRARLTSSTTADCAYSGMPPFSPVLLLELF